jgi:endonuclease/exonuclease/phosphatase (EEP) superfamily protein YafD
MALQPLTRRRSRLAWLAVAGFGSLSAYLLLARWFWPAEILCHFRPILGAFGLLAALATLGLRLRSQALALCALALICAWPTLALCMPRATEKPAGKSLRVATVNLLWGSESFDALEPWLDEEQPAVVFISEVDSKRLPRIEGLRERGYPYQFVEPPLPEWHAKTWGNAVISRLPLSQSEVRWPGPILDARVEFEGRALRVLGAHPLRPGRAEMTHRRNVVLAELGVLAGERADVVVLGDLNMTESTPRFGELLEAGHLADTRAGRGPMGTWRVTVPRVYWDLRPLRLPLDHVLIGPGLAVLDRRIGPDIGSDHLPVTADVAWRDLPAVTAPR